MGRHAHGQRLGFCCGIFAHIIQRENQAGGRQPGCGVRGNQSQAKRWQYRDVAAISTSAFHLASSSSATPTVA
jgi:hypothetical protein